MKLHGEMPEDLVWISDQEVPQTAWIDWTNLGTHPLHS